MKNLLNLHVSGASVGLGMQQGFAFLVPKVFTINEDVDYANMAILDALPGEEVVFHAYDKGNKKQINRNVIAHEKVVLKVGTDVMFI